MNKHEIVVCVCALVLSGCQGRSSQPPGAGAAPPAMPVNCRNRVLRKPSPFEVKVVGVVEPSSKVEIKSQVAGQFAQRAFR